MSDVISSHIAATIKKEREKAIETDFLLEAARELYRLTEYKTGEMRSVVGLLAPNAENSPFAYGRPALAFRASINNCLIRACITSADDSGWTFYFESSKSPEEAQERFNRFINWMKTFEYRVPSLDRLTELHQFGCYVDRW